MLNHVETQVKFFGQSRGVIIMADIDSIDAIDSVGSVPVQIRFGFMGLALKSYNATDTTHDE